jgi:predicted lipid-binding transport protein (Tim44 family)
MACISRVPQCGDRTSSGTTPEPITKFGSVLGTAFAIIGGVASALGAADKIVAVVAALGGASAGGVLSAFAGGVAVIILVGMYALDRCVQGDGLRECVAGVVANIVESFSDAWQNIFPFTGMHDRVELIVKSRFWDVLESSGAYVHCTDDATPRRSEIMRCYFYSKEVCAAATGSQIGAGVGAVGGIIAGAAIAAAIGCATVILCIFALILAFLVAVVAALVGALIGGQIGKAASENSEPSDSSTGNALATGDLVTINGQRSRREYDENAWVMWWVSSASFHGHVRADIPSNPFSYCEIDEELPMDSCPLPPIP